MLFGCVGVILVVLFAPSQAQADRVHKVDLSQLLVDWQKDPAAVTKKHQGGVVETTGYLTEVKTNIAGQTLAIVSPVRLHANTEPCLVVYFIDPALVSQIKQLNNDWRAQTITVQVSLDAEQLPGLPQHLCCRGVSVTRSQQ
jgi:hypothetical protein